MLFYIHPVAVPKFPLENMPKNVNKLTKNHTKAVLFGAYIYKNKSLAYSIRDIACNICRGNIVLS